MNRQVGNILVLYAVGVVFWSTVVLYRETLQRDVLPMRQTVLAVPHCDGWCAAHFLHYVALGYAAPDYWAVLILIGFLFELVEVPMMRVTRYVDSKLVPDTLTNSLGVLVGVLLYRRWPVPLRLWPWF